MVELISGILGLVLTILTAWLGWRARKQKLKEKAKLDEKESIQKEKAKVIKQTEDLARRQAEREKQKEIALDIPVAVNFKTSRVRKEFTEAPSRLQDVVMDFCRRASAYGKVPTLTRVREEVEGSSGIHEAGRAVDIRDYFDRKYSYSIQQRKELLKAINETWKYGDGSKPTMIWHSFNGGPHHFHIQVHHDDVRESS